MLKPDCPTHGPVKTDVCMVRCELVWDVFENAWVSRDYWDWVNQIGKYRVREEPHVR